MGSWLDNLEARLEQTLEAFLRANPQQEALLADQDEQDRRRTLQQRRLELSSAAEQRRQRLLELAREIRLWQERVQRAEAAGAAALATRARDHLEQLMEQGRREWQSLASLGEELEHLQAELQGTTRAANPTPDPAGPTETTNLEQDWARFEADQELERLRRRG